MITFSQKGTFKRTESLFARFLRKDHLSRLKEYGEMGVNALAAATPKDTGKTSKSWSYEIVEEGDKVSIFWSNSNVNDGVNIAVIVQYGHGTKNGGYVAGRDYINPAIQPIFDKIAEDAWRKVVQK